MVLIEPLFLEQSLWVGLLARLRQLNTIDQQISKF